jgi:CheY-like chemotaxis protein
MSIKRLLYIDDSKIPEQIGSLKRKLKLRGFDLDEVFIDLGNDTFKIRNDEGKIVLDKEKIHQFIKDNLSTQPFDIIASDYDFKDPNLDGYELLRRIKRDSESQKYKFRRAKFCLYSADQDNVVKIFDTPNKIKELIKLKIDDFIKRENIPTELTELFTDTEKTYSFKNHIIPYLEKYGTERFKSVYPKLKDKSLADIAHEIDKDNHHGIAFQKYLVELTLAHLIELNNFPKE